MKAGQLNTDVEQTTDVVDSEPTADEAQASEASSSETTEPASAETAPEAEGAVLSIEDAIKAATEFLHSQGFIVRAATASQRATLVKADPDEVKAYFESTGLTRAQLADAVGVTVSVIATVQNQNGDRWSQTRFEAAVILIEAYRTALAAKLAAPTTVAQAQA